MFFTQLERVLQVARGEGGMAALFLNEREPCTPQLQTESLLMRLILNSMALLHAEMGRLHHNRDHDGTALIERFERERFCTDVQLWCFQGRELGFDRLFDDARPLCVLQSGDRASGRGEELAPRAPVSGVDGYIARLVPAVSRGARAVSGW